MLKTPRLKPHLNVEVLPPDKVFLLAESGYQLLSAQSCAAVVRCIDGVRTSDEIVEAVAKDVTMAQAYYILALLEKKKYIEEATDALSPSAAAFWTAMDVDSVVAAEALSTKSVSVHSFGDVPVSGLLRTMASIGIRVTDEEHAALRVALVDDYLQEGLEAVNEKALGEGKPWMIAKANGAYSWLGPVFTPGRTGCWRCLSQRLRANRDVDTFLQDVLESRKPFVVRPALPTVVEAALNMIATEVAKWIVLGGNETLDGKMVSFNTAKLDTQVHTLVKRPQCPACGDPRVQARVSGPIEIQSRKKVHVVDGGFRNTTPDETVRRLEHHVSPITGVVNKLVRITDDADRLQHVYVSGANIAVRTHTYDILRSNLRSRTAGKGLSDAQAKASAIGEAIERYSGTFRGDEAKVTASFRALEGRGINPNACMMFSEAQYRQRQSWIDRNNPFMRVPLPFDEDAVIDWAPVYSLTHEQTRYLPMEYCYYSVPIRPEHHFALPDSNGCAAGNSREEAMLQGFLELIERDAVCFWWYNRLRRPALDLDSFDDPYMRELTAFHRAANRDLWVLDMTADLGVPVFVAITRRNDKPMEDIVFAPACHLDPLIAAQRALTEMTQIVSAVLDVTEGGVYTFDDPTSVNWWKTATLANQPHFVPSDSLPRTRRSDFEVRRSDDIAEDLRFCQSLVEKQGMEVLVLDQSRPDIEMSVMKMIVPGLRHFWARFGPGRLYDVPVRMGWLDRPLAESELNPIPVFI
ncbi:TOMM precursor leader peptide-binding protein [Chondromyces crocatus]|uniref:YcaO domain-containing protein n=1 Tax=Chondromyces crocatus TaxID=52 RepID=A0A0K1EF34_CHOCO|nr:TOMM precursor leader peptide-binding protein [Chondromyces crocatus]AKT39178.1 uncharacterized protein CMC5_033250 [Chondromyces crocatus]